MTAELETVVAVEEVGFALEITLRSEVDSFRSTLTKTKDEARRLIQLLTRALGDE